MVLDSTDRSPSTSHSLGPVAGVEEGGMDKAKRYDRGIRVWGAHGQAALEAARVCLLNAGPTGTEVLQGGGRRPGQQLPADRRRPGVEPRAVRHRCAAAGGGSMGGRGTGWRRAAAMQLGCVAQLGRRLRGAHARHDAREPAGRAAAPGGSAVCCVGACGIAWPFLTVPCSLPTCHLRLSTPTPTPHNRHPCQSASRS